MNKDIIKERDKKLKAFKKVIIKHNNDLPTKFKNTYNDIDTNSWFNIHEYSINDINDRPNNINVNTNFIKKEIITCMKVKMILNNEQKNILNKWFDAYTDVYNEAVKYIKSNYQFTKHNITKDVFNKNKDDLKIIHDYYKIRKELRLVKKEIQQKYTHNSKTIYINNLDYAVKQLCSNIAAAKTNLKKNNIKRFRIKYWNKDRVSKTIDIYGGYIIDNKIVPDLLGDIRYMYNGKDVDLYNMDSDVKINYNKVTNEYRLLIPIKNINKTTENKPYNLISLDPGLRTFMTGVSEDGIVKIGKNVNNIIGESIERLNNIKNNKYISNKIKKKNELMINRKIGYKIDDLHWKTKKYLTQNYKTILIGDMSSKDIVKKNSSVLNNIQKVACLRTKYYEFTQRLELKCQLNNVNYELIDESYTSKVCSCCGNYNKDLGAAKVYDCKECKISIDRDANGSRNIYIKSRY